ncbi:hypothetical protein D3C79_721100 [compost metagenome]
MGQQVVDLRDQGLKFCRYLSIELRTLALLQLGDLFAGTLQWAQRARHGDALQHQDQQQRDQAQAQADLLHAPEAIPYRGVVLGDADGNGLTQAPVIGAQYQQLLAFRPQFQSGVQTGALRRWHVHVPQRTRSPAAAVEINAKVIAGKRPLVGRGNPSLIQFKAGLAAHQRHQQVFAFLAQAGLQVALQPGFEQPQAELGQDQPDQHQYRNQAKAQACLDRLHSLLPA